MIQQTDFRECTSTDLYTLQEVASTQFTKAMQTVLKDSGIVRNSISGNYSIYIIVFHENYRNFYPDHIFVDFHIDSYMHTQKNKF